MGMLLQEVQYRSKFEARFRVSGIIVQENAPIGRHIEKGIKENPNLKGTLLKRAMPMRENKGQEVNESHDLPGVVRSGAVLGSHRTASEADLAYPEACEAALASLQGFRDLCRMESPCQPGSGTVEACLVDRETGLAADGSSGVASKG